MMLALLSLVTLASCSKDDPFPATPEESAQGQVSLKKMLVDITNEEVVMRSSIDVAEFIEFGLGYQIPFLKPIRICRKW